MKKLFLSIVLLPLSLSLIALYSGCGDGGPVDDEEDLTGLEITGVVWETLGGGDLLFSITPQIGRFVISVERFDFQEVDKVIYLSSTDPDVHDFVTGVFEKSIDINDYTFIPIPENPLGSWTSITLKYEGDREARIPNIRISDPDMRMLSGFVLEEAGLDY